MKATEWCGWVQRFVSLESSASNAGHVVLNKLSLMQWNSHIPVELSTPFHLREHLLMKSQM